MAIYTRTVTHTFYFPGSCLSHLLLLASTISKKKIKERKKNGRRRGKEEGNMFIDLQCTYLEVNISVQLHELPKVNIPVYSGEEVEH